MANERQAAFISYSREDSEFALRLARDLKAAGAAVWLDQLDIAPGQRWARAVQEALNDCPRMLIILSPASASSTNVDDEVGFALEEGKTVIPVLFRECKIPFRLRPFQYVDFRGDYDHGLQGLVRVLSPSEHGVDAPKQSHPVVPESVRTLPKPVHLQGAHQVQEPIPDKPQLLHRRPYLLAGVITAAALLLTVVAVLLLRHRPPSSQPTATKTMQSPATQASTTQSSPAAPIPSAESAKTPPAPVRKPTASSSTPGSQLSAKQKAAVSQPIPTPRLESASPVSSAPARVPPAAQPKGDISALQASCDGGDQFSCTEAGKMYEGESGIPKDLAKAVAAYGKGCKLGNQDDCGEARLATFKRLSAPTKEDISDFKTSCEGGDMEGCDYLGLMYDAGTGVPQDMAKAIALYRKACNGGSSGGCFSLGNCYDGGRGVAPDKTQAVAFFSKACDGGDKISCSVTGTMYEKGSGIVQDTAKAIAAYRKGCKLGTRDDCDAVKRLAP